MATPKKRFKRNTRQTAEITKSRILVYLFLGFIVGGVGGSVFMGTSHAIIETKDSSHYKDDISSVNIADGSKTVATQDMPQDTLHILCTGNGSPYQNYQTRIVYGTWQLTRSMPGGDKMVAFTRILHRSSDDILSDIIPTFRAEPLHPECDGWCEYPVADRANAVRVFLETAKKQPNLIQAPWLYMIESDYVFMKPLPVPEPQAQRGRAWGSPFGYIVPTAVPLLMRRMYPETEGPVSDIPSTGPAPILMRVEDWHIVTPEWERFAAQIEADSDIVKRLGWVREMYGFSVALAIKKIDINLAPPPMNIFISQLPPDKVLGEAHAFHYTLNTWFQDLEGNDVWKYDKRFYTSEKDATNVPLIPMPPPYPGKGKWKFLEGNPVTEETYDAVVSMIAQMNRAIETLEALA